MTKGIFRKSIAYITRNRGVVFFRAGESPIATLLGAIVVSLTACSTGRPATHPTPVSACTVGSDAAGARDTLSIATMEPVDPTNAPAPTNAIERLAFAQVYETLIDVDCDGAARPALAASWTFDATRTRVTLSLRGGAQFSSGKSVTAADVLAAWQTTAARSMAPGQLARRIAGGTTIVDEHTLVVSLPDTAWLVLADPILAVYEPRSADGWPASTGAYRVESSDVSAGALVLAPMAPSTNPYLIARPVPSGDLRDAIDAGADVLVAVDPLVASYAAARATLAAVPLPWTRTYVLALPTAALRLSQLLSQPDSQSVALRASLARDAVRAQARPAESPSWWDAPANCGAALDAPTATREQRSNRVVYRREDATARGLAARLVALDSRTVAAGLLPNEFARALREGGDVAYVLDLPAHSLSPCTDLAALRSAAPWLASGFATDARLLPLVDTRETALINRKRVSATVDWSGTLHFGGARSQP